MQAGTVRQPRNIDVHNIELPGDLTNSLLAFHVLTGCDSTSQFFFELLRNLLGKSLHNHHIF